MATNCGRIQATTNFQRTPQNILLSTAQRQSIRWRWWHWKCKTTGLVFTYPHMWFYLETRKWQGQDQDVSPGFNFFLHVLHLQWSEDRRLERKEQDWQTTGRTNSAAIIGRQRFKEKSGILSFIQGTKRPKAVSEWPTDPIQLPTRAVLIMHKQPSCLRRLTATQGVGRMQTSCPMDGEQSTLRKHSSVIPYKSGWVFFFFFLGRSIEKKSQDCDLAFNTQDGFNLSEHEKCCWIQKPVFHLMPQRTQQTVPPPLPISAEQTQTERFPIPTKNSYPYLKHKTKVTSTKTWLPSLLKIMT